MNDSFLYEAQICVQTEEGPFGLVRAQMGPGTSWQNTEEENPHATRRQRQARKTCLLDQTR